MCVGKALDPLGRLDGDGAMPQILTKLSLYSSVTSKIGAGIYNNRTTTFFQPSES